MKDIYKDLIACLLCYKTKSHVVNNKIFIFMENFYHPSLLDKKYEYPSSSNLSFLRDGFIFNYGFFVNHLSHERKVTIFSNSPEFDFALPDTKLNPIIYSLEIEEKVRLSYNENIVDPVQGWTRSGRVTVKESDYNAVFDSSKNRVRKGLKANHEVERIKNGWITYSNNYKDPLNDNLIDYIVNNENLVALKEEPPAKQQSHKLFDTLLKSYIGENVLIPYDMDLRKKKFEKAFIELEKYCVQYTEQV